MMLLPLKFCKKTVVKLKLVFVPFENYRLKCALLSNSITKPVFLPQHFRLTLRKSAYFHVKTVKREHENLANKVRGKIGCVIPSSEMCDRWRQTAFKQTFHSSSQLSSVTKPLQPAFCGCSMTTFISKRQGNITRKTNVHISGILP